MKMLTFAGRTAKEIVRDPVNLGFGLGFPVILILLLSAIQANIPVSLFKIENLAPAIVVFGLAFMTLFSATLIAKDRTSSFLQRLYTTPLNSWDFILGYILPMLPISIIQTVVCYLAAAFLGFDITWNSVFSVITILPTALFFISLGLLCGSIFNDKQVGGLCGALLTNLTAWLSGIWFDLDLVGSVFKQAAYALPFVHAVEMQRAVANGNFTGVFPHVYWVLGYMVISVISAVAVFLMQMKKQ